MSIAYYQDANGIQHESYDAACHYYGADTPAQLAAEDAAMAAEERKQLMDLMMAGVVQPGWSYQPDVLDNDIPF